MTTSDRVLVAAYLLDLDKMDTLITLPDLAVKCWELWPSAFAMEGYDHPDPHKVRCVLYSPVCLGQRQHLIRRVKPTVWQITERGRTLARELRAQDANFPSYVGG